MKTTRVGGNRSAPSKIDPDSQGLANTKIIAASRVAAAAKYLRCTGIKGTGTKVRLQAIWIGPRASTTLSVAVSTGSFFPFKRYGEASQCRPLQPAGSEMQSSQRVFVNAVQRY